MMIIIYNFLLLKMYKPWEKEERMCTKNAQEKFG